MKKLIAIAASFLIGQSVYAESIISKPDADNIFSMSKTEWNSYASNMEMPGWKVQLLKGSDGIFTVGAVNQSNGIGLSIQTIYMKSTSNPSNLIVTSLYPAGTFPEPDETVKKEIESEAQKDLGEGYKVFLIWSKDPYGFDGMALHISQNQ